MYVCMCVCVFVCICVCMLVHKLHRSISWVGRRRGTYVQDVKLSPEKNITIRAILRELFHVLGRYHEHVRYDRDYYVRIHPKNIAKGEKTTQNIYS